MHKPFKSSDNTVNNSAVRPSDPGDLMGFIDLIPSVSSCILMPMSQYSFSKYVSFIALKMKGASCMLFSIYNLS